MSFNRSIWPGFALVVVFTAAAGPLLLSGCKLPGQKDSSDSALGSDTSSNSDSGSTSSSDSGQQFSDGAPPLNPNLSPSGITVLHNFGETAGDGQTPSDGLLLSGGTLYGMTGGGGINCGGGAIFSMGTDGSNYTVLHCFPNDEPGGSSPTGHLAISGNTLYGMTFIGGTGQCPWYGSLLTCGTIFSIGTDGSNFRVLHNFAGGSSDGAYPSGSLSISGNTLYGTTSQGGDTSCAYNSTTISCGTIFSIGIDGSNFHLLHAFANGGGEGAWPLGGLVLSGGALYGVATLGGTGCGSNGCGTIYRIGTDGSSFTILKYFTPVTGANPCYGLTLSGNTLYGTTVVGGPDGCTGTLFSMGTDGSNFNVVYAFVDYTGGDHPAGGVVVSNGWIYGMSDYGGDADLGVLYKVGTDGSGYTRIASFSGVNGDGANPTQSLIVDGNTLYGMTINGGLYQGTNPDHDWCPIIVDGVYYNLGGCGVAFSFGI